jgi:hypothetical protein
MTQKKSLVSLAKGNTKSTTVAKKPAAQKKLSASEERDLKAKQKVEELLHDVPLSPKKETEVLELDEGESTEGIKSVDWLSEQVAALTAENNVLKTDLDTTKQDYKRIFEENQKLKSGVGVNAPADDSNQNQAVFALFNELQAEYLRYPPEVMNKTSVNVRYLLDKIVNLFPVARKLKKY